MVLLNLFLRTVSVWGTCKCRIISYYWMRLFKVQMGCYPSIKSVLKEDYFFAKALDGRTPDYPSEKLLSLKYHNSHDTLGVAVEPICLQMWAC